MFAGIAALGGRRVDGRSSAPSGAMVRRASVRRGPPTRNCAERPKASATTSITPRRANTSDGAGGAQALDAERSASIPDQGRWDLGSRRGAHFAWMNSTFSLGRICSRPGKGSRRIAAAKCKERIKIRPRRRARHRPRAVRKSTQGGRQRRAWRPVETKGRMMLDSLGQVLPHAARVFGDQTALVIEGRVQLSRTRRSVERAGREPRANGDQARRPGDALRAEFLGMDRQLLRRAEDRGRDQSGQRDADPGRGRLCDQGLRGESPDRQRRQGQASAGRRGDRADGDRLWRPVGHRSVFLQRTRRQPPAFRARRGQAGGFVDHRLHLRHNRASQGRDAVPSRRHPQRRHDGAAPSRRRPSTPW